MPTQKNLAPICSLLAVGALALAGCGSSDDASGSGGTLTVFAAASLTSTFTELGEQFEADHDGVTVTLSFGGSSDLVSQIQEGAPADVFASADEASMDKLADAVEDRQDFASNTLEIAVPPGNPAGIAGFADLAKPDLKLVICAPEVPCGTATQKVVAATGVTLSPLSQEQSVTDVLGKVTSGEADAGVVYRTDVEGAGEDVEGVTFPEASSAVNTYPIAEVAESDGDDLAQEFIDLVLSDAGQSVLADAGFAQP